MTATGTGFPFEVMKVLDPESVAFHVNVLNGTKLYTFKWLI